MAGQMLSINSRSFEYKWENYLKKTLVGSSNLRASENYVMQGLGVICNGFLITKSQFLWYHVLNLLPKVVLKYSRNFGRQKLVQYFALSNLCCKLFLKP